MTSTQWQQHDASAVLGEINKVPKCYPQANWVPMLRRFSSVAAARAPRKNTVFVPKYVSPTKYHTPVMVDEVRWLTEGRGCVVVCARPPACLPPSPLGSPAHVIPRTCVQVTAVWGGNAESDGVFVDCTGACVRAGWLRACACLGGCTVPVSAVFDAMLHSLQLVTAAMHWRCWKGTVLRS